MSEPDTWLHDYRRDRMKHATNAVREAVLSQRATKKLTDIYCVVVKDQTGMEGIVRRDTPIGTQPWMTDDRKLAGDMLVMAQQASGFSSAYLARFKRVKM